MDIYDIIGLATTIGAIIAAVYLKGNIIAAWLKANVKDFDTAKALAVTSSERFKGAAAGIAGFLRSVTKKGAKK